MATRTLFAHGPGHGADRASSPGAATKAAREPANHLSESRPGKAPMPTGEEKLRLVRQMFDAIATRYEMLNTVMTLGMDRGWRRRCVEALGLQPRSVVLDVACGTGDLCRELTRHGLVAVGVDISPGMLAKAHTESPLVLADATSAPVRDAYFDGIVSGFALRNIVDLEVFFAELARATRPGGRISLLDLGEPEEPVLRAGHRLWCRYGVPLIGRVLSDAAAYMYLPRSLAYLPPAGEVADMLERAGFVAVEHEPLSTGISQLFTATRSTGPSS